jgi:phosphomannomutase
LKLHLMPTCGTRYYRYNKTNNDWELVYAEDFNDREKRKIIRVLEEVAKELGYKEKKVYGEIIEDRGSQISWSAYGQDIVQALGEEGLKMKEDWDSDDSKKQKFVEYASPLLPEFEVRAGGTTTIDVTKRGIDKAYGMQKLMKVLNVSKEQIYFIGDRIYEGGNDYPVKVFGIDTLQVAGWEETAAAIEAIVQASY